MSTPKAVTLRAGVLMLVTAALALAPLAGAASAGGPTVTGAWARTTTAKMGAAYLTVKGYGTPDRLVAAAVPMSIAMEAQLHRSAMGSDGMMSMKQVTSIPVPATGTVGLKPGGYHVMLMGLKRPLVAGKQFKLTLTFARAGRQAVTVTVRRG
jgi:copper(I)-binding protein